MRRPKPRIAKVRNKLDDALSTLGIISFYQERQDDEHTVKTMTTALVQIRRAEDLLVDELARYEYELDNYNEEVLT